jgi:hypothetical protein
VFETFHFIEHLPGLVVEKPKTLQTRIWAYDPDPERGCAESQPQHALLKAAARMAARSDLFPLLRLALRAQPRSFPQVSGAVSRCGPWISPHCLPLVNRYFPEANYETRSGWN